MHTLPHDCSINLYGRTSKPFYKNTEDCHISIKHDDFCILLTETARFYFYNMERLLNDQGSTLTFTSLQTLGAVIRYKGEGLNDIAARMNLTPMTIISHINRLERNGLVERRGDAKDRRRKPIYPTQKAYDALNNLAPSFNKFFKVMTRTIAADELAQLVVILSKVRANMTTDPGFLTPATRLSVGPETA